MWIQRRLTLAVVVMWKSTGGRCPSCGWEAGAVAVS
jgi:hypothetical protein